MTAFKELGVILLTLTYICIALFTASITISSQLRFLKMSSCDSNKRYREHIFKIYDFPKVGRSEVMGKKVSWKLKLSFTLQRCIVTVAIGAS